MTSKLLFDIKPLVINRDFAKLIGLNESIIIQQIHYWIINNKEKGVNFYEERYWTYNSYKKWHENDFPFWRPKSIQRIIIRIEKGLVPNIKDCQEKLFFFKIGNFNTLKIDKTKWYSINYDAIERLQQLLETPKNEIFVQPLPPKEVTMTPKSSNHDLLKRQAIPESSKESSKENSTIQDTVGQSLKKPNTNSVNLVSMRESSSSISDESRKEQKSWKRKEKYENKFSEKEMRKQAQIDTIAGAFLKVGDIIRKLEPEFAIGISKQLWDWDKDKGRDAIEKLIATKVDIEAYTKFFLKKCKTEKWIQEYGFSWGVFTAGNLMSQFMLSSQAGKADSGLDALRAQRK